MVRLRGMGSRSESGSVGVDRGSVEVGAVMFGGDGVRAKIRST